MTEALALRWAGVVGVLAAHQLVLAVEPPLLALEFSLQRERKQL